MKEEVYIVLLNYNGALDTIECIQSLLQLNEQNLFKIVVVDNSETFTNFEQLKQFASNQNISNIAFVIGDTYTYANQKIIFIKSLQNKGFAAGNNLGIQFSLLQPNCTHIWLLNNDTTVTKNSLNELLAYHKKQPNTILGSKLLYYHKPNVIQAVGGKFNTRFYISEHIGEGLPSNTPKEKLPSIDYPVGAAMFISKHFIEKVGLLNENYFLYYEELDWVKKAQSFGFVADWCPTSIVYHKEGATIGSSYKNEKSFFSEIELFKSRQKFIKAHYGLNTRYYFSTLLLILNRLRKGKFKLANALLKMMLNDVK